MMGDAPLGRMKKLALAVAGLAVVAGVAAIFVVSHGRPPSIAAQAPPTARELAARAEAAQRARPYTVLRLEDVHGEKSKDGDHLLLAGTVINSAAFDVRNPKIRCMLTTTDYRQAGQPTQTLAVVLPAEAAKPFSKLDMGPLGANMVAHCSIVDAEQAP